MIHLYNCAYRLLRLVNKGKPLGNQLKEFILRSTGLILLSLGLHACQISDLAKNATNKLTKTPTENLNGQGYEGNGEDDDGIGTTYGTGTGSGDGSGSGSGNGSSGSGNGSGSGAGTYNPGVSPGSPNPSAPPSSPNPLPPPSAPTGPPISSQPAPGIAISSFSLSADPTHQEYDCFLIKNNNKLGSLYLRLIENDEQQYYFLIANRTYAVNKYEPNRPAYGDARFSQQSKVLAIRSFQYKKGSKGTNMSAYFQNQSSGEFKSLKCRRR